MSAAFTPGPWKTGDCDSFLVWACGFRSVSWIECDPGPEAVFIASAECPPWGRRKVLDALSFDDFDNVGNWEAECSANARLIASAPDGFDFADAFLAYVAASDLDDLDFGRGLAGSGLIEQAKAFRAKALGEAA